METIAVGKDAVMSCGLRRYMPAAAGAVLVAAAAGCSARLDVREYPRFYQPGLKTVAVTQFANHTAHPRAGELLTGRFAEALAANGTYKVVGPAEVAARLAAAKVSLPSGADAGTLAAALRQVGGVDAVVTGSVTAFSADRAGYVEPYGYGFGYGGYGHHHSGYGWAYRGYWPGYDYPRYYYHVRTRAYVAATAAMVRVADGETIHATAGPVEARAESEGRALLMPEECLSAAAKAQANRLVAEFAIVERHLRVKPRRVLRTAERTAAGGLEFTGSFRATDKEMLVVVRLPEAAAENDFRLVVTKSGDEKPLEERRFVWPRDPEGRREFIFSPQRLEGAGGTGGFEVRLYAGAEFVCKRGFQIK